MSTETTTRLPPGSTGLPLLGETLAFLRDPYGFVRERTTEHGRVFRTSLFGKSTAVIVGPEAASRFIDPALIERRDSQPSPVFRLFAGPSVPHLDGDAFLDRKAAILSAFTRDALTGYLPATLAFIEKSIAGWATQPGMDLLAALKRMSLEVVAQDMMSVTDAESLERLHGWYGALDGAFTGLPVPLPGTLYKRGLVAVESILAYFHEVIAAHRERPNQDGLSRVLAHRSADGVALTDDQAARELHHLMIAGRVLFAHLVTLFLELTKHPEIKERLRAEIDAVTEITVSSLHGMDYLQRVMMEVKRLSPVVPGMFGKAKVDFELGGYTIPKGWMIMFGLRQANLDAEVFADPSAFDPERFAGKRKEHEKREHALVPHAPGKPPTSHHCAGTDYATQTSKLFAVALLRGYDWSLANPDVEYDWAKLTPDPKGLVATLKRR